MGGGGGEAVINDYAKFHQNIASSLPCVASWNLGAKCPETGFF